MVEDAFRKVCKVFGFDRVNKHKEEALQFVFNQEMEYWKHQGQQSASETRCYSSEKHLEASHLELGNYKCGYWSGAVGLTAPKVNKGGR